MARGDINEYYDPRHERQMAEMLKRSQAMNQGTHLGGLASLLTQLHRGFRMQKDRKQRADTTEAVADAMSKSYKAPVEGSVEELVSNIDNASIMADPDEYPKLAEKLKNLSGTGAVSTESEMIDKDALKQQMGVKDIFPQLAEQIDPNQLGGRTQLDNAFVGRDTVAAQEGYDPYRRALSNLRALGGDNPYAARMAANMGMQQAGTARAARIAADVRDEERRHKASLLEKEHARKKELQQQAGPFGGKSSEMTYRRILQRASPNSKQYAAAYSALAAGRVTVTPDGNTTTVTPDMSMYLPPTFRVGDGQPATAVVPQPAGTVGQPTIIQTGRRLPRLTSAEKKVDIEFAKHYAEAFIGGKAADTQKQINQLGVSIELLKGSDNITGPAISALPDALRERFYPASADAQEKVAEVTQRNLKAVLGGQFTEKEGDKLIARAYNPRLEEAYNIQRVTALKDAIQKAFDAKVAAAQYYEGEGNGSLRGYKGTKFWSMADIEAHALGPAGVSEEDIQETMRANAMSRRSVIDKLNGVTP